eukprot:s6884_g2.t1
MSVEAINEDITQAVRRMQTVVELGRTCRERRKVGLKMPLKSMTIMNKDEGFMKDVKALQKYIEEELNVMEVVYKADAEITLSGTLNFKALGKRLGKDMKTVKDAVTNLSQTQLVDFEKTGEITVEGHKLTGDDIQLARKLKDDGPRPFPKDPNFPFSHVPLPSPWLCSDRAKASALLPSRGVD